MKVPSDESAAWFFMGEGCATITCCKRKEKKGLMSILGFRLDPRIALVNTDSEILKPIELWLESKGIIFNPSEQKRVEMRYRPLFGLRIRRHKEVEKFLTIIIPYLYGRKRKVCDLLFEYVKKFGRDWSNLMREKVIRDPKTGRIKGVNWNVKEERQRFLEMMKYRDKIVVLNSSRAKEKYNYAYFAKLWGMKVE